VICGLSILDREKVLLQNFPTYKSVTDLKFMIKETRFTYICICREKYMPLILIGSMPVLLPSSPKMAVTLCV